MLDDVGRPDGVPVLYLHGTPDSRLARPTDDGLAAHAGVRVLALDRPGYGGSDPVPTVGSGAGTSPAGWVEAVVGDGVAVLDELRVERCGVVAWSGGALTALAVAAGLPERIAALGIVAGLVPRQAYHEPAVREAGGDRLATLELAEVLPPGELGEAVAPLVAPSPPTSARSPARCASGTAPTTWSPRRRSAAGTPNVSPERRSSWSTAPPTTCCSRAGPTSCGRSPPPPTRSGASHQYVSDHAPTATGRPRRGHRADRHRHVRLHVRPGPRSRGRAGHRHRHAGRLVDHIRA